MTTDAVFWLASLTKAVTAVAAVQQVECGRLALEQPAGDLMPQLDQVALLEGFDAAGAPLLRTPRHRITLRHLLTHTSGFGYHIWNADLLRYRDWLAATEGEPVDLLRLPLTFEPGQAWQYGRNLDWAGRAVELVTGRSLADYVREHIAGPLGLTDLGFEPRPDQAGRLAGMYQRTASGGLQPAEFPPPAAPALRGGGGLVGTAWDYLRFLQALLPGNETLLSEASAPLWRENQTGNLEGVGPLRSAVPALSSDLDFFPGLRQGWSLGLMNLEPSGHGRGAGTVTWSGMRNTFGWIDPGANLAAVLFVALSPWGDPRVLAPYREFERALYAELGLAASVGAPEIRAK